MRRTVLAVVASFSLVPLLALGGQNRTRPPAQGQAQATAPLQAGGGGLQNPWPSTPARRPEPGPDWVKAHYAKQEVMIPMRDGARLFTAIYSPRDTSHTYPILMTRTPYSVRPYGEEQYPTSLGPAPEFAEEGFIFVYQDVRGAFMSEGTYVNMRPVKESYRSATDIDETTDTYDTVEWLVTHAANNNGRAGQYGISYPGFYTAAGMVHAHPALVAVSPQAPVTNWFGQDDFHHNGALWLPHCFGFFAGFGHPRPQPNQIRLWVATSGTDSDFAVKLIDVFPDRYRDAAGNVNATLGGYQMLVRGDLIRGKFRNSLEKPEAFTPNQPTAVTFTMSDVYHTFLPGHRIMIQIQSTWFPLADRNPQRFENICQAAASDFQKATERIYHTSAMPSRVKMLVLPPPQGTR